MALRAECVSDKYMHDTYGKSRMLATDFVRLRLE